MLFMALAGVNALYFEFVIAQRSPVRENHSILPSSVRYAGMRFVRIVDIGRGMRPIDSVPAGVVLNSQRLHTTCRL